MKNAVRSLLLAVAAVMFMAGAAYACPPPPPPPPQMPDESAAAYAERLQLLRAEEEAESTARHIGYQQQWWDGSASVLLARVERKSLVTMPGFPRGVDYARSPRSHLRPVTWLKGSGPSRRFHLNWEGLTSCGPHGGGDAVEGAIGDVFLVFVREGRPSQASVITTLALDRVVNPELRARIEAAQ